VVQRERNPKEKVISKEEAFRLLGVHFFDCCQCGNRFSSLGPDDLHLVLCMDENGELDDPGVPGDFCSGDCAKEWIKANPSTGPWYVPPTRKR